MYIMDIIGQVLPYLVSIVTGVVGWVAGRKKQQNDFLVEAMATIDMLTAKHSEILKEMLCLRQENLELRANQTEMLLEISRLREELEKSRAEQEAMSEILKKLNIPKPSVRQGRKNNNNNDKDDTKITRGNSTACALLLPTHHPPSPRKD